jgi:phosphoesterase RecJ-like protein
VNEAAGLVAAEAERDAGVARIAQELRSAQRFLLTTHEGPDGDALGSMLALQQILGQLGKDSVMFLAAKEFPLPVEYRFLPLAEVFHEPPVDIADRVVVFLDCGNIDRMPVGWLGQGDHHTLNIDHHHDNTRFGSVNLVDTAASCTAEIVFAIAKALDAELTPCLAGALYVGLVTDTGRFMYANASPAAHRMAAELIEAGVEVNDVYRRLYERVPIEKLRLISRALSRVERHAQDALAITYISAEDYAAAGASEILTEGIVDHVRGLEGASIAAVVRDREGTGTARKVSLRSTDGLIDVSAIARRHGGGGHPRAAGFSTDLSYAELVDVLGAELEAIRR